jgi:hypothetical protein
MVNPIAAAQQRRGGTAQHRGAGFEAGRRGIRPPGEPRLDAMAGEAAGHDRCLRLTWQARDRREVGEDRLRWSGQHPHGRPRMATDGGRWYFA